VIRLVLPFPSPIFVFPVGTEGKGRGKTRDSPFPFAFFLLSFLGDGERKEEERRKKEENKILFSSMSSASKKRKKRVAGGFPLLSRTRASGDGRQSDISDGVFSLPVGGWPKQLRKFRHGDNLTLARSILLFSLLPPEKGRTASELMGVKAASTRIPLFSS